MVVDGYFDAIQAFDDYYEVAKASSQTVLSSRPNSPLVRHAPRDGPFPPPRRPMREAVSSPMRREHAARL
jgi:hypothetical protein